MSTEEEFREFARTVVQQSGTALRVLVYHDVEESEVLFVRDDVRQAALDGDGLSDALLDRWRDTVTNRAAQTEREHPHGTLKAVVTTFEDAILIHIPAEGDKQGVSVGLDPVAGRRLNQFVSDLRAELP